MAEIWREIDAVVECRKKIEEIGEKTSPTMSQEEIVSSTKTVVQGLETLRVEHHQVLNGLQATSETTHVDTSAVDLIEEKMSLLKKSIETIELAMGEAQVMSWLWLTLTHGGTENLVIATRLKSKRWQIFPRDSLATRQNHLKTRLIQSVFNNL